MPMGKWDMLNKILTDALASYNELNAAMDLVLFEDAMSHICRLATFTATLLEYYCKLSEI